MNARDGFVVIVWAGVVAVSACSRAPDPVPLPPPTEVVGAADVGPRTLGTSPEAAVAQPAPTIPAAPVPDPVNEAPALAASAEAAATLALVVVPADAQYVCVADVNGEQRQTSIAFAPNVAPLCRNHPEMGPCQYERNVCRRSGGRVYAEGGVEITGAMEAEYDRKVMRVRINSN